MKLNKNFYNAMAFFNGLVFYAPVSLFVRTQAGVSLSQFFLLQALLSCTIFLGEIPAGLLTDKIGYKKTLILSQGLLVATRSLLLLAYIRKSFILFVLEALLEGIAVIFTSGTGSSYLYEVYGEEDFLAKTTRACNWGTVGFVISTVVYMGMYQIGGLGSLMMATIVACALGFVCSFGLKETHRIEKSEDEETRTNKAGLGELLKSRKLWLFTLVSSCLGMGFILINFFYAEKMELMNINVVYLTPVILGYSCIQLLAERILRKVNEKNQKFWFRVSIMLTSAVMILFGLLDYAIIVVALMLILPLLINIPEFILEKIENEFVDSCQAKEQRATVLSMINMGVNLLEIVFLCASAIFAKAGIATCFVLLGVVTLAAGFLMKE